MCLSFHVSISSRVTFNQDVHYRLEDISAVLQPSGFRRVVTPSEQGLPAPLPYPTLTRLFRTMSRHFPEHYNEDQILRTRSNRSKGKPRPDLPAPTTATTSVFDPRWPLAKPRSQTAIVAMMQSGDGSCVRVRAETSGRGATCLAALWSTLPNCRLGGLASIELPEA